jgi:2-dehydropantoate 2-reductase
MKIGIVGQGAIGSLFAYYYQHVSPTLLVKDINITSKQLLTLDAQPISLDFTKLNVSQSRHKSNSLTYFDALIITVKGYQLPLLVKQLSSCLSINTRIILIQNGMGGAQILAEAFPNHIIYVGTTTDAVYKVDEDTYQITAMGKLDIGPFWKMSFYDDYHQNISNIRKEKAWMSTMLACHPNAEYHDEIAPALYKKLAINAVINTLTALLQIKNGQLNQYLEEVNTLKLEIFAVYSAANIAYSKRALSQAIDDVIEATSNNWSSMQQDIKFKRQTENESILGYILSLSQQHALDTPFIKKLYTQLKDLDNRLVLESKK